MRLSQHLWFFILAVLIHSMVSVEGRKSKSQSDEIEEYSNNFEQKKGKKTKNYNKFDSKELNSKEDMGTKFKTKGEKQKQKNWEKNSNKYEEVNKFDKAKKYNKYNKKLNEEISSREDNKEKDTRGEITTKKARIPKTNFKNNEKMSMTYNQEREELPKKSNKKKEYVEESDERLEDSQMKTKSQKKKQENKKLEQSTPENREKSRKMKRQVKLEVPLESEDSEEDEESDEGGTDEENNTSVSEYCTSKNDDLCSDDENAENINTEDEEELPKKKVRYSTKFAHEKSSKKNKDKEAENILKLHRKAEVNQKSNKPLKRENRYTDDEEEESDEEIIPRKRRTIYDDEEI